MRAWPIISTRTRNMAGVRCGSDAGQTEEGGRDTILQHARPRSRAGAAGDGARRRGGVPRRLRCADTGGGGRWPFCAQ